MANNLTLGTKEVHLEHSGDESEDDDDDVVEQSPCGRWEKRRQEVIIIKAVYRYGIRTAFPPSHKIQVDFVVSVCADNFRIPVHSFCIRRCALKNEEYNN